MCRHGAGRALHAALQRYPPRARGCASHHQAVWHRGEHGWGLLLPPIFQPPDCRLASSTSTALLQPVPHCAVLGSASAVGISRLSHRGSVPSANVWGGSCRWRDDPVTLAKQACRKGRFNLDKCPTTLSGQGAKPGTGAKPLSGVTQPFPMSLSLPLPVSHPFAALSPNLPSTRAGSLLLLGRMLTGGCSE